MFFHTWADLGRVVVVSGVLFALVVAMLRVVGQRALAKMSGYDVVLTVTLGSIVASVILVRTISVADAVVALATLMGLQEGTRWIQARWLAFHHIVRDAPHVVLWNGRLLEARMSAASVSADEVRAAVRRAGLLSLHDAQVVVLENDGEWSVMPRRADASDDSALFGLDIPGRTWGPARRPGEAAEAAARGRRSVAQRPLIP
jgi:uncharacterized membrane protein YcaP (DUF421 family)